jgi:hypothetical protein
MSECEKTLAEALVYHLIVTFIAWLGWQAFDGGWRACAVLAWTFCVRIEMNDLLDTRAKRKQS